MNALITLIISITVYKIYDRTLVCIERKRKQQMAKDIMLNKTNNEPITINIED